MSNNFEHSPQNHIPSPDEPSIPELEVDQTIAPRPEEEIADALRAEPDLEDHSQHPTDDSADAGPANGTNDVK